MRRAAPATAAVALVTLVWITLQHLWYAHDVISDVQVYRHYGNAMVHHHRVPYRDFRLEYPPAALPVFLIPALTGAFLDVFQALMALCHLAIVLTVLRLRGRAAAALAAVVPLLLGSVTPTRYDLWPTALAVLALGLLVSDRSTAAAIVLGTGFAAKLWPGVLAPVFCIWLWQRHGPRAAGRWLGIAGATAAAWFVPFLVLGPRGVAHSFYLQFARPLQIESFGGAVLVALHDFAGSPVGTESTFGSQNVVASGTHAAAIVTTLFELVAILAVYGTLVQRPPTVDGVLVACAAAVTAMIAFGKVFSPQYLVWLAPFVPLAARRWSTAFYVTALVLTQIYFPKRYWAYATGLHHVEVGLVVLRDLTVVALFGLLLYALQTASAASSSRASPAVS
ncbi:MAG: hypothetical protein ABUS54_06535 [Actinomycetota bacterium]